LELEEYLENLLNKKIDLVSRKALKQPIKKQIMREVEEI
jgi:predicted nucleotidyltransferase